MELICLHCFVSGRVQGVFFRRHAKAEADALGLKGWARNLSDGRVELMVCGEAEKVNRMQAWVWKGPDAAEVSAVETEVKPYEVFSSFEVN